MSDWGADPQEARWWGEVIGSRPGEDVDCVYGYSASLDEPDIATLVPEGWEVDETTVRRTPGHPDWEPGDSPVDE